MRRYRTYALGAAVLSLLLLASGCSKKSSSGGGGTTGGGPTLASTFVFGAPPDCATNKYCAIGLKNVYGIVFKQVRTTDFGGPITVHALKAGSIQVGELFSTSIYDPDFVALEDDKHLENADNIVPVMNATKSHNAAAVDAINKVSAALTTDGMLALNKQVDIGQQDPAAVAKSFLQQQGLLGSPSQACGSGFDITVGVSSSGFSESPIVAQMYGQVLENIGCNVSFQLDLADRKVSDAALFSGKIDLKPEYLASEATALDANAKVSGDSANNAKILTALYAKKGVAVLNYSPAIDTNVFVVTKATADKYHLSKVSDLAKPAP
jgi:osmoprotectant transport system substrate-binding protein